MSNKTGGQLPPEPNRKTGSRPHKGGFGSIQERGGSKGTVNPKSFGQQHVTKGGPGQGGSGSARKVGSKGRSK